MPAGSKLIALAVISVGIAWINSPAVIAAVTACTLTIYFWPGIGLSKRLANFKGLLPIALVIGLSQYLASNAESAISTLLRFALMMLLADLVTLSTKMQEMMDTLQPAFAPLNRVGIEPKRIAFAISLTIRLVPLLLSQWQTMALAWRARTGRNASLRLIAPYIANLSLMSMHIADAIDARGLGTSAGRGAPK